MGMAAAGTAICVPGNHDNKLVRKLKGRDVRITHGLAETLAQLEREPPEFREQVRDFLDGLVSHAVLDGGRLVVAHAGMKERYQGRASGRVRDFALYGETTGETDEFGLPVAARLGRRLSRRRHGRLRPHAGRRAGVGEQHDQHRHRLRVRRAPDRPALARARARVRPRRADLLRAGVRHRAAAATSRPAHLLDVEDVAGKRIVQTRLARTVTVREENATAALEVMSRFATDPRWLVYLPPTMSPTATSQRPDLLEHPEQAFAEYRAAGVPVVVCEEKHMGSRAIAVVCRDAGVAARALRRPRRRDRRRLHAHRPPVLRRRRADRGRARPHPRRRRPRRTVGRARDRLARARLRAAAVVGEGDGADPPPVRAGRRRRERRRSTPPWRRSSAPPAAGWSSTACSTASAAVPSTSPATRTPTAATSGRSTASRTCGWRRSTCWRARPACTSTATTAGTSTAATSWWPPTRSGSSAPTAAWSTSPTPRARRRPPPGGRR